MTRRKKKMQEAHAQGQTGQAHAAGQLRPELLAFAKGRSAEVVRRLKKAMTEIELEIEANDRIYPYNGGRVTQAEVCRRAGIRNTTLQGDVHKSSTKADVDAFVARIRVFAITGSKTVRRNVTDRANYWKQAHRDVADAYRIDALSYEVAQKRLKELGDENRQLQEQNASLQEQIARLSGNKVVPIRKRDP
jgi:hypothetical protein